MSFTPIEDRVGDLEALLGQFMKESGITERRHREWQAQREADTAAMKADTAAMKADTAAMKAELKADTAALKAELKDATVALKAALEADTAAMKAAMEADSARMTADTEAFKAEMRVARKELNKQWGDLANRLGTIVEDILAPNLRRLAREHFAFEEILDFTTRRERRIAGTNRAGEFDTVVVGLTDVILGEAKSQATTAHCTAFAEKVKTFFDFHPELIGRRLLPVFGCWAIPEDQVKLLTSLGIYAMQMGEETMELVNAAAVDRMMSPPMK